jgi:RNA polymerase sigma-70 factor (ECF subfamily)
LRQSIRSKLFAPYHPIVAINREVLWRGAGPDGTMREFDELAERYRGELLVHCYRMLGSALDAEDLVQETLLRAWRHLDTFQGRSSFRAWLYRVATNACLNALAVRRRRSLPQYTVAESQPTAEIGPATPEAIWLGPFPDTQASSDSTNPEGHYDAVESVSLAFLAVLQLLPARQRAALILRDVLDWPATDAAEISGLSVPALNSALHRARRTMQQHYAPEIFERAPVAADPATQQLLERYVSAWHAADIDQLTRLLREDVVMAMPPSPSWYRGLAAVRAFLVATAFPVQPAVRWQLRPTRANGRPAFGIYQALSPEGPYQAFGLQTVLLADGRVREITTFTQPGLLAHFGLPPTIQAE